MITPYKTKIKHLFGVPPYLSIIAFKEKVRFPDLPTKRKDYELLFQSLTAHSVTPISTTSWFRSYQRGGSMGGKSGRQKSDKPI